MIGGGSSAMQFRVCLGEEGPEIQSQGGHGHGNRWVKVPETIFECLMRTRNSPAGVPEEEEKVAVLQSVGEISEGGGKHTHAEGKFRVHIPRGAFHRGFGDRLEN